MNELTEDQLKLIAIFTLIGIYTSAMRVEKTAKALEKFRNMPREIFTEENSTAISNFCNKYNEEKVT